MAWPEHESPALSFSSWSTMTLDIPDEEFACSYISSFPEVDEYESEYDSYEYDTHRELTFLTPSVKYSSTLVPIRKDGNPRGKYPRKPLPWPSVKLSRVVSVVCWERELDQYRKRLWQWEVEQKRKRHQTTEQSNLDDSFPDLESSLSPASQEKITDNGPPNTKHSKTNSRPNNNTNKTTKKNKTKARKQKIKAQKLLAEKGKPRLPLPKHYLLVLDAMHNKQGCQKYWVSCPICDKITAEWDGVMKKRYRDWGWLIDADWWDFEMEKEARKLDLDLNLTRNLTRNDASDFGSGLDDDFSSGSGSGVGLAGDELEVNMDVGMDMGDIVARGDGMGEDMGVYPYRVRYVDRVYGRRKRKGRGGMKRAGDLPVPEVGIPEEEQSGPEPGLGCGDELEEADNTTSPQEQDLDNESVLGEWEYIDNGSVHEGSPCTNRSPGETTAPASTNKIEEHPSEIMTNERLGWTARFWLGRWFSGS